MVAFQFAGGYATVAMLLLSTMTLAAPQRSPYAPNPVVYPEVLPQYTSPPTDLDNRFGSGSSTQPPYVYVPTDAASLYPVDNLNWIQSEWPRDKIPFNVINSQHLQAHRGQAQPSVGNGGQQTGLRGSFVPNGGTAVRSSFLDRPN